jgi:nucleoid-associated protein YgaU
MTLQQKYQELIQTANQSGVKDLKVREQGNVLYIDGSVPSEDVKQKLWNIYNKIDPDYRAGDLIMNVSVSGAGQAATSEYVVKSGDSLSKIAANYGLNWKDIYEANKDQIKDPDLIHPGWKLKIPSKS